MQNLARILNKLTDAQIKNFSISEAEEYLNCYNGLISATNQIWANFQKLDIDKSEQRTMRLINSYASGKMRDLARESDSMYQGISFFTKTPPPPINAEFNAMIDSLESTAGSYLEYISLKPTLDKQVALVQERLNQLHGQTPLKQA